MLRVFWVSGLGCTVQGLGFRVWGCYYRTLSWHLEVSFKQKHPLTVLEKPIITPRP